VSVRAGVDLLDDLDAPGIRVVPVLLLTGYGAGKAAGAVFYVK
jgi:hypothetical protein